ncbi:hypothetical protein KDL29_02290 [bacterium]|nr:hypothetical protein [bacterium]
MDQQESSGDITRQQLGGMTNKERFHEGRRIPKQLRRILWELWSPVVTNEDEPDDWQLLEVLDWYLSTRGHGSVEQLFAGVGRSFMSISFIFLIGIVVLLLFFAIGSYSLFPSFGQVGWSVPEIIAIAVMATVTVGCTLGAQSSTGLRKQLGKRLHELDILELVSNVYGSPVSEYDLVRLPPLARGQHTETELVNGRLMADNLELFLGMGGSAVRRRLMAERVLSVLRGTAMASGLLLAILPIAAMPLLLINIMLTNDPRQFTNRRHELLLAMLDEMYADGKTVTK